ncbi:major facilitator superfamily transporter [Ceratobasidium sp. AG-Ba]|nr:major facilitator superfamily transporter [Ceratobasidium sp. AG-Ba]
MSNLTVESATQPRQPVGDASLTTESHSDQVSARSFHRKFDFGLIPIARRLKYEVGNCFRFGLGLNIFFGLVTTLTLSGLYFCEPILVRLADSFSVSNERLAIIPIITQAGYGTGLLSISLLGDLAQRRQLLLLLGCLIGVFTLALALSPTNEIFAGLSYPMRIAIVVPQIGFPLVVDLAPPERRASAISIVLSGLLLGIIFTRVLSGIIAEFATWRLIYWISCGMRFADSLAMWLVVPDYPTKQIGLSCFGILYAMGRYSITEPTLIQCCLIGLLSSAIFANFWVNLTSLLTDAPYHFPPLQIGLFGLIGVLAPLVGRFTNRFGGWTTTVISIVVGVVFQSIFTGAAGLHLHIAVVVIVFFGLGISTQMNRVSTSSWMYAIEPLARARVNVVFFISIFLLMGTSVGTQVYLQHGRRASGTLVLGFHGLQLVLLLLRGSKVERKAWIKWKNAPTSNNEAGEESISDLGITKNAAAE